MKRKWKQKRKKSPPETAVPARGDWSPLGRFLTPDAIHLGDQVGWEISLPGDPALFLIALPAILPEDANLALESTPASMAGEVLAFLESRPATHVQKVVSGSDSPSDRFFHIPASVENLAELADLFDHHASMEICDHFHAYSPGGKLLEWHDSFLNPLYLHRSIPEARVASFCRLVGVTYLPFNDEIDDPELAGDEGPC